MLSVERRKVERSVELGRVIDRRWRRWACSCGESGEWTCSPGARGDVLRASREHYAEAMRVAIGEAEKGGG